MEKSIIEWIKTFGHPYRKQALAHLTEEVGNISAQRASDALEMAFKWYASIEGHEYWNTYWNKLVDKEAKK